MTIYETKKCQLCGEWFEHGAPLFDARTRMGPWAVMCQSCWVDNGAPLGLGRGQEYRAGEPVKVRG